MRMRYKSYLWVFVLSKKLLCLWWRRSQQEILIYCCGWSLFYLEARPLCLPKVDIRNFRFHLAIWTLARTPKRSVLIVIFFQTFS